MSAYLLELLRSSSSYFAETSHFPSHVSFLELPERWVLSVSMHVIVLQHTRGRMRMIHSAFPVHRPPFRPRQLCRRANESLLFYKRLYIDCCESVYLDTRAHPLAAFALVGDGGQRASEPRPLNTRTHTRARALRPKTTLKSAWLLIWPILAYNAMVEKCQETMASARSRQTSKAGCDPGERGSMRWSARLMSESPALNPASHLFFKYLSYPPFSF